MEEQPEDHALNTWHPIQFHYDSDRQEWVYKCLGCDYEHIVKNEPEEHIAVDETTSRTVRVHPEAE